MSKKHVLLIGGPLDGRRQVVHEGARIAFNYLTERHEYELQPIMCDSQTWWMGVHQSLTVEGAINRLFAGYPEAKR